ncbi:MAG: hypothetical protein U5N58_02210 [Actinomycetota bacterium]|nr:hypothetical protein [Actinomycetota bacterium]
MRKPLLIITFLILALLAAITIYLFLFQARNLQQKAQAGRNPQATSCLSGELSYIDLDSECYSLEASQGFLYMGLNNKIAVMDVSHPASLKLAASTAADYGQRTMAGL